jgi:hypothetical protein
MSKIPTTTLKVPKLVAAPNAKISGFALLALTKSIYYDEFKDFLAESLQRHGYTPELNPETWYSLQMYYDFLRELPSRSMDSLILVSIGIKAIETAILPVEIDSIASGILLLKDTHHLNMQNVPEHEGYHNVQIEDQRITFMEQTSFPHDIMYGYIYGLVRRFAPRGTTPVVIRSYLDAANPDSDGAHYEIKW